LIFLWLNNTDTETFISLAPQYSQLGAKLRFFNFTIWQVLNFTDCCVEITESKFLGDKVFLFSIQWTYEFLWYIKS
jgi:hypothetical protein